MRSLLSLVSGALLLTRPIYALKLASALQWIEHTPQRVAAADYYKDAGGVSAFQIVSGGVASLFSDSSVDLAANAETQALRNYYSHRNLRTIYTISEVTYRIVGSKKKGIRTLADLKGKRIGATAGTSAAYFVSVLAGSAGVPENSYTLVSGGACMASPCGAGSLTSMLQRGTVDAIGYWEPTIQLAIDALGDDAVVFGNASIYREIYNLHTTTDKLRDPAKKRDIVAFVKALNQAEKVFREDPESIYPRVSQWVGVTVPMLRKVWPVHAFRGTLAEDLLDEMVIQDAWVAKQDRRQVLNRATLAALVDGSILMEASGNGTTGTMT